MILWCDKCVRWDRREPMKTRTTLWRGIYFAFLKTQDNYIIAELQEGYQKIWVSSIQPHPEAANSVRYAQTVIHNDIIAFETSGQPRDTAIQAYKPGTAACWSTSLRCLLSQVFGLSTFRCNDTFVICSRPARVWYADAISRVSRSRLAIYSA